MLTRLVIGRFPRPVDFEHAQPVPGAPKEVSLLTTGSWAGRMDCKYEYAASYFEIGTWGFASSEKTSWRVCGIAQQGIFQ